MLRAQLTGGARQVFNEGLFSYFVLKRQKFLESTGVCLKPSNTAGTPCFEIHHLCIPQLLTASGTPLRQAGLLVSTVAPSA